MEIPLLMLHHIVHPLRHPARSRDPCLDAKEEATNRQRIQITYRSQRMDEREDQ